MDSKRQYNELRDYKKMKNRDIEISLELERGGSRYRKKEKRYNPEENYRNNNKEISNDRKRRNKNYSRSRSRENQLQKKRYRNYSSSTEKNYRSNYNQNKSNKYSKDYDIIYPYSRKYENKFSNDIHKKEHCNKYIHRSYSNNHNDLKSRKYRDRSYSYKKSKHISYKEKNYNHNENYIKKEYSNHKYSSEFKGQKNYYNKDKYEKEKEKGYYKRKYKYSPSLKKYKKSISISPSKRYYNKNKSHEYSYKKSKLNKKKYYKSTERKNYNSYNYSKEKSRSDYSKSSSSGKKSSSDVNHYDWKRGTILYKKYKITGILGEGTFGRCLECLNLEDNKIYAVKVIKPLKRYIQSAEYECDIIKEILNKDVNNESFTVNLLEYFHFEEKRKSFMGIVFETLGKSLFDFIKDNDYRGFSLKNIQKITWQILKGISYLHEEMKIVHTDLKPENILFTNNKIEEIHDKKKLPINVIMKEEKKTYFSSPSTESFSRERVNDPYFSPLETSIKIIDFGAATRENEKHSEIINTRQYRAPEVILGSSVWDEKSDIWGLACIFAELYTGELLFQTHDNKLHVCQLEKISGPIPFIMADNAKKEFRRFLDNDTDPLDESLYRVDFSKIYGKDREKIMDDLERLETLDTLIHKKHHIFKKFLKEMLIIDPKKRPSCRELLKHEFFSFTDFE